jgi:hypothetical protein
MLFDGVPQALEPPLERKSLPPCAPPLVVLFENGYSDSFCFTLNHLTTIHAGGR